MHIFFECSSLPHKMIYYCLLVKQNFIRRRAPTDIVINIITVFGLISHYMVLIYVWQKCIFFRNFRLNSKFYNNPFILHLHEKWCFQLKKKKSENGRHLLKKKAFEFPKNRVRGVRFGCIVSSHTRQMRNLLHFKGKKSTKKSSTML